MRCLTKKFAEAEIDQLRRRFIAFGKPPALYIRNYLSKFLLVGTFSTITYYISNSKCYNRNDDVDQLHIDFRIREIRMKIINDDQQQERYADNKNGVDHEVITLGAENFPQ